MSNITNETDDGLLTRKERLDFQAALNERVEPRVTVIAAETDRKCELCGKVDETRPYGPNGEDICWDCGQKNRAATYQRMAKVMFNDDISLEEAQRQADTSKAVSDAK